MRHLWEIIKNKYVNIAVLVSVYLGSIVEVIISRNRDMEAVKSNALYWEISQITFDYQLRQIVASVALFMAGYCIVSLVSSFLSDFQKMVLSMPIGIALWGIVSIILLILRVPYTSENTFGAFGLFFCVLLAIKRKHLQSLFSLKMVRVLLGILTLANFFSLGYPRYTVTADTSYCIYTYGRLIAASGALNVDEIGNYLETTGIMPALIASFAVFCGFETIYVIHFTLMTAFFLSLVAYLYEMFGEVFGDVRKKMAFSLVIVSTAISPLFLMCDLILSHSWMMAYIFFVCTASYECKKLHIEERSQIVHIISFLFAWISLVRVEGVIICCFFIVCISCLGFSRRELLEISIPMIVLNCVFRIENQHLLETAKNMLPYGTVFLTPTALFIIFSSMFLVVLYIAAYESSLIFARKEYLLSIILVFLLVSGVFVCCLYPEKAVQNFGAILYNLTNFRQRWYFFPIFAVILLVIMLREKKKYEYWDVVFIGYVLLTFCMCMGRIHPLRNGWGDSFNRYMLSSVPLFLVMVTKNLCEKIVEERRKLVSIRKKGTPC